MARIAKCSITKLRRHIPRFLDWGWCSIRDGNLIFNKHSQLPERKQKKKTMMLMKEYCLHWSIDGILTMLQAFVVKNAMRRQQWATSPLRGDMRVRAARANLQGLTFSVIKAAKQFRTSMTSGSRILCKIGKAGYYHRIQQPLQVLAIDYFPNAIEAVAACIKKGHSGYGIFTHKGRVLMQEPSRIVWVEVKVGGCREINPIN